MRRQLRRSRRGYPIAVLLGVTEKRAVIWTVHSESLVPGGTIKCQHGSGTTSNPRFVFFENIVSKLKQIGSTGVKSIVIASPRGSNTNRDLLEHVRIHHAYLLKQGSTHVMHASTIDGEADDVPGALDLVKSPAFKDRVASTVDHETKSILDLLDAVINNPNGIVHVHFTLDEIDGIFNALREEEGPIPEYLIMTETYYATNKNDARLQRTMALAKRMKVKTRVIQSKTGPGARIAQLGGLVCFTSPPD